MKSVKEHRGCALLKSEENEEVFRLIGNRCQCLAAGVIQLYLTEPPAHREWIKRNTGVITLIRDTPKRSYFLRLYCLKRKAMLWEQELYHSMSYNSPLTYFHTFEGEDCMAAFNFADETEAMILRNVLIEKLNTQKQRRQDRKARAPTDTQQRVVTLPRRSTNSASDLGFSSSASIANGSPSSLSINGGVTSLPHKKKNRRTRDPKRKLTTADIGSPSDFRHVAHMGWDPQRGLEADLDNPTLKQFFNQAGITEQHLTDKKTRDFIYDYIDNHGGMTAVKNDLLGGLSRQTGQTGMHPSPAPPPPPPPPGLGSDPPPPIPARTVPVTTSPGINHNQTRSTRPLPPVRTNVPPPPPSAPPAHRTLPTRPPPPSVAPGLPPPPPVPPPPPRSTSNTSNVSNVSSVSNTSSASVPAPPPPPPPPPLPDFSSDNVTTTSSPANSGNNSGNNNGHATDPRLQLMDAIRSGTTLKKVEPVEKKLPPINDTRSDLLNQIREGVALKPVSSEPKPATDSIPQGGLAGALSRALAERSRLLGYTGDSGDESSDTSEDDEWDD